jgi:hypothetical protein
MQVVAVSGSDPKSLEDSKKFLSKLQGESSESAIRLLSSDTEEEEEKGYDERTYYSAPSESGDGRIDSEADDEDSEVVIKFPPTTRIDATGTSPASSDSEGWEEYRRLLVKHPNTPTLSSLRTESERDVEEAKSVGQDNSNLRVPAISGEGVAPGSCATDEAKREGVATNPPAKPSLPKAVRWPQVQGESYARITALWAKTSSPIEKVAARHFGPLFVPPSSAAYVEALQLVGPDLAQVLRRLPHFTHCAHRPVPVEGRPGFSLHRGRESAVCTCTNAAVFKLKTLLPDEKKWSDTLSEYACADFKESLHTRVVYTFSDLGKVGRQERSLGDRFILACKEVLTKTPLMTKILVAELNKATGQTMSEAEWRTVKGPAVFEWFWESKMKNGVLADGANVDRDYDFITHFSGLFTHCTEVRVYSQAVDQVLSSKEFIARSAVSLEDNKPELTKVATALVNHLYAEWCSKHVVDGISTLDPKISMDTCNHLHNQVLLRALMSRIMRPGGRAAGVGPGAERTAVPFRCAGPSGLPHPGVP